MHRLVDRSRTKPAHPEGCPAHSPPYFLGKAVYLPIRELMTVVRVASDQARTIDFAIANLL